jgi:monodechloroaminopyrrolnitrin synthase
VSRDYELHLPARIRPDTDYDTAAILPLDPLGADPVYPSVPAMNAVADTRALAGTLESILPSADRLNALSFHESLAAMRDIGLFLGSLKRHGVEPVEAVPRVEPILLELGRRTDMIPRDTVHHYTEWNPTDARQRTHTGEPMETYLTNSTRMTLPHLRKAVALCHQVVDADLQDPQTARLLAAVGEEARAFEVAVTMVIDRVTPEFFAQVMRPYYESCRVGAYEYYGPAAAHVPLFLLDTVLWASDRCNESYGEFIRDVSRHTLPSWRAVLPKWQSRPSLVTRVLAALREGGDAAPAPGLHDTAVCLRAVLQTLTVFRAKHIGIARKAYKDDLKLFELGSGGGSLGLLHDIVLLTRENARLVSRRETAT